jgi:DNA polymerase
MEGFFTVKETQSISRPEGKVLSCQACGLYKDVKSPRMKPFGNFKKKILIIGEAPGEAEDKTGKPWQGKVGKLLQRTLDGLGIDLFEDCLNINACLCRPTDKDNNNRSPSNFEVECCRKAVLRTVDEYKPRLILLLGNIALFSLIGHRWKKDLGGITKWRGYTIPDRDFNCWICPAFHPSFVERSADLKGHSVEEVIWKQDLKQAFELLEHPFPEYIEPEIDIINELSVLKHLKTSEIAFDYETTGLKPHAPGHRIICVSVADTENHAYVFLMPKTKKERQPFIDLLTNPHIGKVAQNMKYEHSWSRVRLQTIVTPWVWDTMLASHVFDNRAGTTNLKFQVYVNFGIVDYASEVAPYFEAIDNKNGNGLNRITDLLAKPGGEKKLLKYCGYDAIYERRLAEKQRIDILPF